jgi:hypothetical protein
MSRQVNSRGNWVLNSFRYPLVDFLRDDRGEVDFDRAPETFKLDLTVSIYQQVLRGGVINSSTLSMLDAWGAKILDEKKALEESGVDAELPEVKAQLLGTIVLTISTLKMNALGGGDYVPPRLAASGSTTRSYAEDE